MMTKMKYCNALYVVRQHWAFSGCRSVMLVNFIWHEDDDNDNDDDDAGMQCNSGLMADGLTRGSDCTACIGCWVIDYSV